MASKGEPHDDKNNSNNDVGGGSSHNPHPRSPHVAFASPSHLNMLGHGLSVEDIHDLLGGVLDDDSHQDHSCDNSHAHLHPHHSGKQHSVLRFTPPPPELDNHDPLVLRAPPAKYSQEGPPMAHVSTAASNQNNAGYGTSQQDMDSNSSINSCNDNDNIPNRRYNDQTGGNVMGDSNNSLPSTEIPSDFKALARSERKRSREKQRRSDVNKQFSDLTSLLRKIEAEDADDVGARNLPSFSAANRVELIARTIHLMTSLQQCNKRRKKECEDLKKQLEDAKIAGEETAAKLKEQMMAPTSMGQNRFMMMVPMMIGGDHGHHAMPMMSPYMNPQAFMGHPVVPPTAASTGLSAMAHSLPSAAPTPAPATTSNSSDQDQKAASTNSQTSQQQQQSSSTTTQPAMAAPPPQPIMPWMMHQTMPWMMAPPAATPSMAAGVPAGMAHPMMHFPQQGMYPYALPAPVLAPGQDAATVQQGSSQKRQSSSDAGAVGSNLAHCA